MKNFFKIILIIISTLLVLLLYSILNTYFPSNILSKIVRAISLVLTPVLIALIIMYLINPLIPIFTEKLKMGKKSAIGLAMFIFIIIFLALIVFSVYFLSAQYKEIYDVISDPSFLESIKEWFYTRNLNSIYDAIHKFVVNFDFSNMFYNASSLFIAILQGLASVILAPIFLWHFMNSQDKIIDTVNDNIPSNWKNNVIPIIEKSNNVIQKYFQSKIISIVILFFMFLFTYIVLGLPIGFAILFSFLIATLDLIPYVGPTIGLLLPIIYLLSIGGTNILYINSLHVNQIVSIILLVGINTIIQFVQGNIIVPKLVGDEMNINAGLILAFMLFFGYILGVWGILLSIPLGGVMIVIWKHIKSTGFLEKN